MVLTGSASTGQQSESEVLCDLRDAAGLQRLFETRGKSQQFVGIIHLAAVLPTAAQREPLRATQVNIEGSLHLLEAARRFGVHRLVFGSSLSVYGSCPADQVVSERQRAAPEDLYAAAKVYVEQLGEAYRRSSGLEFISLRIGRVVGCGSQSMTSAWRSQIFEHLTAPNPTEIAVPYIGSERILLVHVDDVARTLVALLTAEQPAHAVYNAPCESVAVSDLKREVEQLNSNITVELGQTTASGNPRLLDSSRIRQEFAFEPLTIFEQLRRVVGHRT
jgi:nucleoside-diphosphate-sugar epimerase